MKQGVSPLKIAPIRCVIDVGRCSDLGGDIFFKQQKYDFLEKHAMPTCSTAMKFIMQTVGKVGGASRPPCPPPPRFLRLCVLINCANEHYCGSGCVQH